MPLKLIFDINYLHYEMLLGCYLFINKKNPKIR